MIFIIGGQSQGKMEFALEVCGRRKKMEMGGVSEPGKASADSGFSISDETVADGRTSDYEEAMTAPFIIHLECYIRRLMEEGRDPAGFADRLMSENGRAVVTADEIGYGIVPADAFLREYRETDGRICQKIAAFSDEVYRVVCGLGTRIK